MSAPEHDPSETEKLIRESNALREEARLLSRKACHIEAEIKRMEAEALAAKARRKKSGIFEAPG